MRQHMLGNHLRALRGGMDAVHLNRARHGIDAVVNHRHQWHMLAAGHLHKDTLEAADVVRSVVGRKCDSNQQHSDSCRAQPVHQGSQIALRMAGIDAAQSVVASKLDDHHLWMLGQYGGQSCQRICGGVSRNSGIHYAKGKGTDGQQMAKSLRITHALRFAVAGRDAVSEAD